MTKLFFHSFPCKQRSLPTLLRALFGIFFLLSSFTVQAKTYDKDYVGAVEEYTAVFEDTLVHLARAHNLGFVEMRAANPFLDPWIPGAGAKITLPKQYLLPDAPREGIVINLPEMRLYYYPADGGAPKSYAIGIGREGLKTPTGTTTVTRKKEGPTWRPTKRMREEDPELPAIVYPGPLNPMGSHALYLGWPQYAIHGTNKPYGIGRRISSGCIRLYPEKIGELYNDVPIGTKVTVVDQPVKVGWIEDKLFIEIHPTQDQSLEVEKMGALQSYTITEEDIALIEEKAGAYKENIDWGIVREAVKRRSGYPVMIFDSTIQNADESKDDSEQIVVQAEEQEALQEEERQEPDPKPKRRRHDLNLND